MAKDVDMMVVASKMKAYIKDKGCMTSGDTAAALNSKLAGMLDEAVARTQANKRATVKPQDL